MANSHNVVGQSAYLTIFSLKKNKSRFDDNKGGACPRVIKKEIFLSAFFDR